MVQQAVVERVDRREAVDLILHQLLDEAGDVARIGDQQVGAAGAHREQEAAGQREDVVERQRAHDQQLVDMRRPVQRRLQPGVVLQHVGDDVAMEQGRALGYAGGAAGILQEGDVVGTDRGLLEALAASGRERSLKPTAPGSEYAGTIFFRRRTTRLTITPLKPSRSPMLATMTCLTGCAAHHLLYGVGKVLQHDDRFGAEVLQLVLELARRVERVDVDDGVAGAQHAGESRSDIAARSASSGRRARPSPAPCPADRRPARSTSRRARDR